MTTQRTRPGSPRVLPRRLDGSPEKALPPGMELSQLTDRAVQLHESFAARRSAENKRAWTREEIMQGFVVDVGDLMKLVLAKNGARAVEDVDRKLAHELSDCLWSVLVLAKLYGVDLESEFLSTMTAIETKLVRRCSDG